MFRPFVHMPTFQTYNVTPTLPAGLEGAIPAVTQCPEALASTGTCLSTSRKAPAWRQSHSNPNLRLSHQ